MLMGGVEVALLAPGQQPEGPADGVPWLSVGKARQSNA